MTVVYSRLAIRRYEPGTILGTPKVSQMFNRWYIRFHFETEHYLCGRPVSQDFPGARVEPILYLLDLFVRYLAKVRSLWEVLPHQAVGVLVQSALLGMIVEKLARMTH